MNKEVKTALMFKYDRGMVLAGSDLHNALTYIKELEQRNEQLTHQQRADRETIKKLSEIKPGRSKENRVREGSSSRSAKRTIKNTAMEGD